MITVRHAIMNFTWIQLTIHATNAVESTIRCVLLVITYSVLNVYGRTTWTLIRPKDNVFQAV